MSETLPSVSLVVLNHNGRGHLADCLPSVLALDYPADRLELIVCDNGSSDGSAEFVRQSFPTVKLVALDRNHGFAEANDLAAREAGGDWVGFLNNDMWVPPNWLRELTAPLARHANIASLASRIANWDGSRIDFTGGSGANFQGYGFQRDHGAERSDWDREGRVLYACGGAMLVRRDVFLDSGGFDPDYFIYYEDVDLGWRLNLLGHDVWYVPGASVNHRHHGTTATWADHRKEVLYHTNALSTMYKNLDDANLSLALPASLLLLNEQALVKGAVDSDSYRMGPASAPPYRVPPAAPGAARVGSAISRRLPRPATRDERLPKPAVSPLVAMSRFAHRLEALQERRRWVQSHRRRSDDEVLPLFHYALFPSSFEPRYIQFQAWLRRVTGIEARFAAGQDATS